MEKFQKTNMRFLNPIILILTLTLLKADGFDTLSYYNRFDLAVNNYKEGRFRLAENKFSIILKENRNYRDPAAQLMMGKSQYRQGKWNEAIHTGKSIISNYHLSPYDIHARMLLGDIALTRGKPTQAFEAFLKIRSKIKDPEFQSELDKRLLSCVGIGLKEDRIEGILFRENNDTNRNILNLIRAYFAWQNGDGYDLAMAIEVIDSTRLPILFQKPYSSLIKFKNEHILSQNTLAVLLPISGINKEKGQSYLLGLSEYIKKATHKNSIRFLVYDTGGISVNTLNIVKSLISNRSIIGVLGPLLNEEVLAVSGLGGALPILIPKSGSSGLAAMSSNLFFLSPSHKTIAHRMAQLMVNEMGLENIAILSPGDAKSKFMTDQFIDELFQLGVDPVALEWYHQKPENISRQFKSIRKVAWDLLPEKDLNENAMNMVIDSLDALFDVDVSDFFVLPEEDDKMVKRDSVKIILETIQALYIPIRENELTYVGTQLPIYNLNTILFGNENWLNMEELNQDLIGPHVQGMHIVSEVSQPKSRSSEDVFSNYFALAVDHAAFIDSIVGNSVMKRRLFIEKLRKHSGFNGKHTYIQFTGVNKNENGVAQVLEYSGEILKHLGVFDGDSLHLVQ